MGSATDKCTDYSGTEGQCEAYAKTEGSSMSVLYSRTNPRGCYYYSGLFFFNPFANSRDPDKLPTGNNQRGALRVCFGACSSTPAPTPAPTLAPTPEPTPAPTPVPTPVSCCLANEKYNENQVSICGCGP